MDVNDIRPNFSFLVSFCSFGFCVFFYIAVAICGYSMFGEAIQSQFTLNIPQQYISSKIAVWTAVRYNFKTLYKHVFWINIMFVSIYY